MSVFNLDTTICTTSYTSTYRKSIFFWITSEKELLRKEEKIYEFMFQNVKFDTITSKKSIKKALKGNQLSKSHRSCRYSCITGNSKRYKTSQMGIQYCFNNAYFNKKLFEYRSKWDHESSFHFIVKISQQ